MSDISATSVDVVRRIGHIFGNGVIYWTCCERLRAFCEHFRQCVAALSMGRGRNSTGKKQRNHSKALHVNCRSFNMGFAWARLFLICISNKKDNGQKSKLRGFLYYNKDKGPNYVHNYYQNTNFLLKCIYLHKTKW